MERAMGIEQNQSAKIKALLSRRFCISKTIVKILPVVI
jgi:hypothetical protein